MPTRAYRRDRKAFRGASLAIADEKRCEVTADWPERFKYILIIVNIYVMTILVPLGFFARVPSLATETPANSLRGPGGHNCYPLRKPMLYPTELRAQLVDVDHVDGTSYSTLRGPNCTSGPPTSM